MTLNLKEKINITKYPEDTNSETERNSEINFSLKGDPSRIDFANFFL